MLALFFVLSGVFVTSPAATAENGDNTDIDHYVVQQFERICIRSEADLQRISDLANQNGWQEIELEVLSEYRWGIIPRNGRAWRVEEGGFSYIISIWKKARGYSPSPEDRISFRSGRVVLSDYDARAPVIEPDGTEFSFCTLYYTAVQPKNVLSYLAAIEINKLALGVPHSSGYGRGKGVQSGRRRNGFYWSDLEGLGLSSSLIVFFEIPWERKIPLYTEIQFSVRNDIDDGPEK